MAGRSVSREVTFSLALARQFSHHADFAGTPRQAVADGYSCIDAALSALLKHEEIDPPRNHRQKLDMVRKLHPDMLAFHVVRRRNSTTYSPGGDWASIEAYYRQWLASRYSRFDLSASVASSRVVEAHQFLNATMRIIARKRKVNVWKLYKQVSRQAFGYDNSQLGNALGAMHDKLFFEAERMGEAYGSKLGTKLASTTNYCQLDIVTGDLLTQTLIKEDEEIADEGARVYLKFNQLVEKIIRKRRQKISERSGDTAAQDALNESPNFMLSMKARYHGATVKESGEKWGRVLADGLSMSSRKHKKKRKG